MIARTTIQTGFPSMRSAYERLLALESAYLVANRRKHVIELTLSSQSIPLRDATGAIRVDDRGRIRMSPEIIEVRAVYDDAAPAQVSEWQWFAGRASSP